jgi:DNA-binding response OmpR family regulator
MIAKPKRILWADDEIDLLRPHILFLNEKGYDIEAVSSGRDAIDAFKEELFDLVFLDEVMPGLSGLETLAALKEINPITPVVMITKSEDEGIMTDAIGKKIADYLIKPVNPHQILLSLKKNLHKDDILTEAAQEGYREEFSHISRHIACAQNIDDWTEIHRKLSFWDIELTASQNPLIEMLNMQKQEANHEFARFVKQNYQQWLENPSAGATLSPQVFQKAVFPLLTAGEKVFFILIDNFRLDQWMEVKEMLAGEF